MADPTTNNHHHHLSHFGSPFLASHHFQNHPPNSNSIHNLNPNPNNLNPNRSHSTTHSLSHHHQPGSVVHHLSHNHPPPSSSSTTTNSLSHPVRATTPARYLGSSSPLPPTSAYALVSSARSLGTPTSDIRGTSPSAASYGPPDDDPLGLSLARPPPLDEREWGPRAEPGALDPPSAHTDTISPTPLPTRAEQTCFWAILDADLKFVYVDPAKERRMGVETGWLMRRPVVEAVHPGDVERVAMEAERARGAAEARADPSGRPVRARPPPIRTSPVPGTEGVGGGQAQPGGTAVRCRFARHALLRRLLATDQPPYPSESLVDGQFLPIELFLNPIGNTHLLAFFHSLQDPIPAPPDNQDSSSLYSPWSSTPTPFSLCGSKEADPEASSFTRDEALVLQRALAQSMPPASLPNSASPGDHLSTSLSHHQAISLDVFLILDSNNGHILFSHHLPVSGFLASDYQFCPEDYAFLAMQSSQQQTVEGVNDEPIGHIGSNRQSTTGQHRLAKDGTVTNVVQSFVIQYGSLTFAAFRSSLPPAVQPQPSSNSHSSGMIGNVKPSPLEFIHDPHPMPLDLYSPTSSRLARAHKRPRTDSCSEVLTPQSAASTQSQGGFSHPHYQRPSPHPSHTQYSNFATHHHAHHPAPQLSPLASSIAMPDSPDPYGYTHFSGELSPTMASAANVLGSFHRAHYHHPQSIIALQDVHHHQLSPPSSAHPTMMSYDNYGLQSLASMAVGGAFEAPPDFSPASSASSPHPAGPDGFGNVLSALSGGAGATGGHRVYRTASKGAGVGHQPGSVDLAADGLLGMGLGASEYRQQTGNLGYGPMVGDGARTGAVGLNDQHRSASGMKRGRGEMAVGSGVAGTASGMNGAGVGAGGVAGVEGVAVRCCTSCGAQNSPEWRKGPNGVKSLCNACGLRFSRAQARKSKVSKGGGSQAGAGGKKIGGVVGKKRVGPMMTTTSGIVGGMGGQVGGATGVVVGSGAAGGSGSGVSGNVRVAGAEGRLVVGGGFRG